MMTASPPLPFPPPFPVYGLARTFTGGRWLDLWNQAGGTGTGPLVQVALGHGKRADGQYLIVVTVPLLDRHEPSVSELQPYGPTGIYDAALSVLLRMSHAVRAGRDLAVPPAGRSGEVTRLERLAASRDESDWSREEILVAGASRCCRFRNEDNCWAVVTETDEVALGIFGNETSLCQHGLVSVNTRLHDYDTD